MGDDDYTAEFWEYDSRIGRRWNRDPITKDWESPYATFSNNPIGRVDPRGNSDTTVAAAGGNQAVTLDQKANSLEYYQANTDYKLSGTNTSAPVRAGQLRSFTNSLGTFGATWTTDASGSVSLIGYKNEKGQTIEQVMAEFKDWSSGFKGLVFSYFKWADESQKEYEKNPLASNLELSFTLLTPVAMEAANPSFAPFGRNTSVVKGLEYDLGVLRFNYVPKYPLQQQLVNGQLIPLADPLAMGYPHTTLGAKFSGGDGFKYLQSATFNGGSFPLANGKEVPLMRIDWYHHMRPWDHAWPHMHPYIWNGNQWLSGSGIPFFH